MIRKVKYRLVPCEICGSLVRRIRRVPGTRCPPCQKVWVKAYSREYYLGYYPGYKRGERRRVEKADKLKETAERTLTDECECGNAKDPSTDACDQCEELDQQSGGIDAYL